MTSLFGLLQLYFLHLVVSQTSTRNYIPAASKIASSRSTTAQLSSNLLQWEHTAPGHYGLLTISFQREKTQSCYGKQNILKVFIQFVPIWTAINVQSLVIPRCLPVLSEA